MSDERQASEQAAKLLWASVVARTEGDAEYAARQDRALLDYIADLEADRARLDWLAENPYAVQPETAVDSSWNTDGFHDEQDGWAALDERLWFADLREAIDAAMSSSPLAPTQEGA